MRRRLSIGVTLLATLLLLQGALVAFLYWPRAADAPAGPLFPNLDAASIERLTLSSPGSQLALARAASVGAEGDGWVLPEADNFPVLEAGVTRLISDLLALDTSRMVADSPTALARLRVDEENPVRRVDVALTSGVTETLYIGSSPNARATNVRRGGDNAVYLARNLDATDLPLDPNAWVDTTYLLFDGDTVRSLTLDNAAGIFALQRDAAGAWTMEGLSPAETVISTTVESWIRTLSATPMLRPLGAQARPEWGLDAPQATITIVTSPLTATAGSEAETRVLRLGARNPGDDSLAAGLSTSPWYAALTASLLDPLLFATRETLVQGTPQLPVSAPGATPAPSAAPATTDQPAESESPAAIATLTATAPLTESVPLTVSVPVTASEGVTAIAPATP